MLGVEPSVCSYTGRRTEMEEFSRASVLISIPLLYLATEASVLVA